MIELTSDEIKTVGDNRYLHRSSIVWMGLGLVTVALIITIFTISNCCFFISEKVVRSFWNCIGRKKDIIRQASEEEY